MDDHVLGGDAPIGERPPERAAEGDAGHDPGEGRDEGEQERLPADHAPHLARGRGDRAQERDLALAELDREAERARDDEHRDEQGKPAEGSGDRDDRLAGVGDAEVLGPAAGAAGEDAGLRAGGRAQALRKRRAVGAGCREDADCVRAAGVPGESRRLGVRDEHDRGPVDRRPRRGDADDGGGLGRAGGGEAHALADAQVPAGREAGVDDDLAARRAARVRRAGRRG